jgi:hypothetical protein
VASVEVLSWNLSERTEENRGKPQSGFPVLHPEFELVIPEYKSYRPFRIKTLGCWTDAEHNTARKTHNRKTENTMGENRSGKKDHT